MPSSLRAPPATTAQPSRKGKKAWRKNVDITEITSGLQSARDEEAITGVRGQTLADLPAAALFATDTAGDAAIKQRVTRAHGPLKAEQILAQRSAVPAVSARKRPGDARTTDGVLAKKARTGGGVHPLELERLKRVAFGGEAARPGDVAGVMRDPWAEEAVTEAAPEDELSFVERKKPVRAPKTLKEAPRSLTASGRTIPNVRLPNAGRSYNPDFDDWSALLEREGEKELAAEKRRLKKAEEEKERLDRIALIAEQQERDDDEENMSAYESEWEGIQSDMEESQLKKKRPERKTPADRNKIKKRLQAARLAKHESRMLQREKQAKKIDELRKSIEEKENARAARLQGTSAQVQSEDDSEGERDLARRAKKKGKIPEAPLELVLPDELQDSLRLLKPEGNLIKDRYRTMVIQGRTEARKPLSMQKQAKRKATEKWSYKDWRLPSEGPRTVA